MLYTHVRTGRWASVMPARLAATLGLTDMLRAIPIVEPEASHTIGLVVPVRKPMKPLTAALVVEARRLAPSLSRLMQPTLDRLERPDIATWLCSI